MTLSLADQVVVVTGASRGIGRAIAIALAREGANVVCAARSTQTAPSKLPGTIDETAGQVEALGRRPDGRPYGRALAIPCDVTKDEEVAALAQRTLAEFGRIDILVNNAGISYPVALADTPIKRWDLVLNINLRGPVLCIKAFLPQMLQQGSGRIINISSALAQTAVPGMLSYSVSKAALERLTEGLALELQPYGIAVNALRIEMNIASEGWVYLNPDMDYSGWERPEAAAEALAWLATRELSFTGQIVTIAQAREQMRLRP